MFHVPSFAEESYFKAVNEELRRRMQNRAAPNSVDKAVQQAAPSEPVSVTPPARER